MGHVAWEAFYWPGGCLLGNLLANIIWDTPNFWRLHKKMNKHHQWHLDKDQGDS